MTIRKYHLAAGGAALAAAVTLAACGSSPAPPGTPGTATPQQPAATAPAATPSTQVNAADVTFTTGMLNLENQAAALAALVPAHTTTAQVRQFAAGLDAHAAEFGQMRDMMGQWGQTAPAPYTPGAAPPAGTGPGMMSAHDWDEMGRMYGGDFNGHFADAMIANRTAELALCRTELSRGASPQAQALARTMLSQRQAELTQLQAWHNQWEHGTGPGMMPG
jgi:uncharacterized protein (DUF305 family)